MAKQIRFRMTAYTAAAGKYSEEAPNKGNEDNFFVDDDLADDNPQRFSTDKSIILSDCGMLMAIADGMGGMNAGEIASEIAINTVKDFFSPGKITPQTAASHISRQKYLENVIVEADKRIKNDAKNNIDHEGMGSTIILAWLVDNELTISWCGDSRAYRYDDTHGLQPLSEDHSYVQELVKQGIITYEQTFDHPQGNIVTRSLGDSVKKAQPETRWFDVYQSDIILLCSDGLSGVLRDEEIENIIRRNRSSMQTCREALWKAAEEADWYDNVTTILCEILEGIPIEQKDNDSHQEEAGGRKRRTFSQQHMSFWKKSVHIKRSGILGILIGFLILCTAGGVAFWKYETIKHCLKRENSATVDLEDRKKSLINKLQSVSSIDLGSKKYVLQTELDSLTTDTVALARLEKEIDLIVKADSILKNENETVKEESKPAGQSDVTGSQVGNPAVGTNETGELTESGRTDTVVYKVKAGDTLFSIAESIKNIYNDKEVTAEKIKQDNKMPSDTLHVGDELKIRLKKKQ